MVKLLLLYFLRVHRIFQTKKWRLMSVKKVLADLYAAWVLPIQSTTFTRVLPDIPTRFLNRTTSTGRRSTVHSGVHPRHATAVHHVSVIGLLLFWHHAVYSIVQGYVVQHFSPS